MSVRRLLEETIVAAPTPEVVVVAGQRFTQTPLFVMLVVVLVSWALLLAIRPPFVLRRDEPLRRAVVPALLWSCVAGVLAIAIPTVVCRPN